jgi:hypothetical protein
MRSYAVLQISGSWKKPWEDHKWLFGAALPPQNPRYLVMTNLVPWITYRSWTLLSHIETVGLIKFASKTVAGFLGDLAKELPDAFAVGHGIDDTTLPYLPSAVSKWRNWMVPKPVLPPPVSEACAGASTQRRPETLRD